MINYLKLKESSNLIEDVAGTSDAEIEEIIKDAKRTNDIVFLYSISIALEKVDEIKVCIIVEQMLLDLKSTTSYAMCFSIEDIHLLMSYADYLKENYELTDEFYDYLENLLIDKETIGKESLVNLQKRLVVRNELKTFMENNKIITSYNELSLMQDDPETFSLALSMFSFAELYLIVQIAAQNMDVNFINKVDLAVSLEDESWVYKVASRVNEGFNIEDMNYCSLCALLKAKEKVFLSYEDEQSLNIAIEKTLKTKKISESEQIEFEFMNHLYNFLEAYRYLEKEKQNF